MTIATMIGGGLNYPEVWSPLGGQRLQGTATFTTETAMAATGDKVAMIGFAKIEGRAASKVISAAGGGSIMWAASSATWANGGTTMDIGIQGVATGSGPPVQPDGTYGVKRTLTGGDGNVTAALKTTAMTGGSGSSTITHGQLYAIVWDMTARAGTDTVTMKCALPSSTPGPVPYENYFTAGAWRTSGGRNPSVMVIADDGTLITFENTLPISTGTTETFADSTNPDERGLIFQIPWDCEIDGVFAFIGITDAASDYTVTLYSDPLGTPASLGSITVLAEQGNSIGGPIDFQRFFPLSITALSANTDYVVAVRANGSTNVRLGNYTLMSAASRALNPGGVTVKKVTRDGGSGAFTTEATPTTMYNMGVRISGLNVSSTAAPFRIYQA